MLHLIQQDPYSDDIASARRSFLTHGSMCLQLQRKCKCLPSKFYMYVMCVCSICNPLANRSQEGAVAATTGTGVRSVEESC